MNFYIKLFNIKLINILLISLISVCSLRGYVQWSVETFLGIGLLIISIVTMGFEENVRVNWVLVFVLLLFSLIHLFHYSRSFLCICLCMYILLVLNMQGARIQLYHIATLFLILPFYQFVEHSVSVPLRIALSEFAVSFLQYFDVKAHGSGNLVYFNGKSYLVDAGCAGLKMLRITLLFCGVYIFMFQDVSRKYLGTWLQVGIYLAFVGLNLFCNVIRIVLLVVLDIADTNTMHYVLGGVCLVLYVLVPAYLVLKLIFRCQKRKDVPDDSTHGELGKRYIHFIHVAYGLVLCFFMFHKMPPAPLPNSPAMIKGYEKETLRGGIVKFSNAANLVYYKTIPSVFSLEHNPTVCWSVEGFVLKKIGKEHYGDVIVYTGEFEKDGEKLYAAWWFSAGDRKTIDQFEWRYRTLVNGENYVFINVNSLTKNEMDKLVSQLLDS